MSLQLQKFVDRVQAEQSRGQKNFVISMADARALHADLTRVLLELAALRQKLAEQPQDTVTTVQMDGGVF